MGPLQHRILCNEQMDGPWIRIAIGSQSVMHVNLYTFLINIDYCINFDTLLFLPPTDHLRQPPPTMKFDIIQIETLNIDSNWFRNLIQRPTKYDPCNVCQDETENVGPDSGNRQLNGLTILRKVSGNIYFPPHRTYVSQTTDSRPLARII